MRLLRVVRRTHVLTIALLCAAAVAAGSARAQTDADLGCRYTAAPASAGPVGHTNPLRVFIDDCAYAWDTFSMVLGGGARMTHFTVTSEFQPARDQCDPAQPDGLQCFRSERHAGGGGATLRPQCPEGAPVTLTLSVSGEGGLRTGETKSFPCTPPPMQVLAPPATQSVRTLLRRGAVARFSCETACVATAALGVQTSAIAGYEVANRTFRRSRGGTYTVRVRPDRRTRRRWRRRASIRLRVSVDIRAASGEEISGFHEVTFRR